MDSLEVRERVARAARIEAQAQRAFTQASQDRKRWASIAAALEAPNPTTSLALLLKAHRGFDADVAEEDRQLLGRLIEHYTPLAHAAATDLPKTLPERLSALGLALDRTSRHPHYSTAEGFITVEINVTKLQAVVASRGGSPRQTPADAEAIAEAVLTTHKRLFERSTRWVDLVSLQDAYAQALAKEGLAPGSEVAISAIRTVLCHGDQHVPEDEFNVDLSKTLREAFASGVSAVSVSNTRDTKAGMLLHQMEQSGYVGYLRIGRMSQ